MGKIRFGFVLTLLLALVVLAAGWHFSRRITMEITPAKRELVDDFSKSLPEVAAGVVEAREDEIEELGMKVLEGERENGLTMIEDDPAVRGVFLFRGGRKVEERVDLGEIDSPTPPEVVAVAQKIPLNRERALAMDEEFFKEVEFGKRGIISSEDRGHFGYWVCDFGEEVTVVLVEAEKHRKEVRRRFRERIARDFGNLAEWGQKAEVVVGEVVLISGRGDDSRVPTMELARESRMGPLRVRAWREEEEVRSFHWPTMSAAALFSVALAGTGGFLFLMQKKAWRESQMRVSFVNRVSHELGTPLTNMTLNLELAARSLRMQPEIAGSRLEKVREEVERLGRLVKNVLIHSRRERSESGDHRNPCQPDEVVADVLAQFRPALERREIKLDWQPSGVGEQILEADALSQIVWNLISNVEKYAASGGWLGVTSEIREGQLRVTVGDHGPGVPPARRGSVFEAFERLDQSTTEGVSGTGLGLTISRELARGQGGDLVILDGHENQSGAVFLLTLPITSS